MVCRAALARHIVREERTKNNESIEAISKVAKNVRKSLLRPVKWSVFGGYPAGSHTQTTIFSSSTIFFQPNFAGLLKLPQ